MNSLLVPRWEMGWAISNKAIETQRVRFNLCSGARESSIEGLDEFGETKHVHRDFNLEDKSYWYPYGR